MLSYANGRYVPSNELSLPVLGDPVGTFRGFRIFTAARTIGDRVFRLDDHIERLFSSAEKLCMELSHSKDELQGIIEEIVSKNSSREGDLLLEIIYSGGEAGENKLAPKGPALLYILVLPLKPPPEKWYQEGINLASYPYQRQFPEVKLLNYVAGVVAHQTVVKRYQAQEALFVSPDDRRIVLEGTTFSFFAVRGGVVATHPLDGKILPGITRRVVLELAEQEGIEVKEDYFSYDDLKDVDEAFITSSTRNVVPVVKVDTAVVGNGIPGEITKKLMNVFSEYQENY